MSKNIYSHTAYSFPQAVEIIADKFEARSIAFPIRTEFGKLIIRASSGKYCTSPDPAYVEPWESVAIDDYTRKCLRDKDISYQVTIGRSNDRAIQEIMIAVALAEVLVRYCTNTEYISDEVIWTIVGEWYTNYDHTDTGISNPYSMAQSYINGYPGKAAFLTRGAKEIAISFTAEYFNRVIHTIKHEMNNIREAWRKIDNAVQKDEFVRTWDLGDTFYKRLLCLLLDKGYYSVEEIVDKFKWVFAEENIHTGPDFLRTMTIGKESK